MAASDDEPLAISLVRQGAQDYLIKSELDCMPLARSMRCAIERHHVRMAHRSLTFIDDLTGLYTRSGFHNIAERHWNLVRITGQHVKIALISIDGLEEIHDTFGSQERDMALILTADILRDSFAETDVIARYSNNQFAVAALDNSESKHDTITERLQQSIQECHASRGGGCPITVHIGTANSREQPLKSLEHLLTKAEASLCENKRSRTTAQT